MTTAIAKTVTLGNGLNLPYAEVGDHAGAPVVFLHAFGDSWRSFETVLERLPAALHGYALTHRGHGNADRPSGNYRPEDMAADVVEFMDAIHIGRAVLVGHSSGSMVAQLVASSQPRRVAGLVLIGAPATFADKPGVAALWQAVSTLEDPVDRRIVEKSLRGSLVQAVSDEFMEAMISEAVKAPARVLKDTLRGILDSDPVAVLDHITAPTLLIWGDRDATTPRSDQETILGGIRGARLIAYHGAGHMVHWEQPGQVAVDLAEFVTDVIRTTG